MKEADLYSPIQQFFKKNGFEVDGEVKKIDIVAIKDDLKIGIELKKELNLKVITQAAINQKFFEIVYIGIFMPKSINKQFKDKVYLLKRLGIGLILVNPISNELNFYSQPFQTAISTYQKRNLKKRQKIINELQKRVLKNNTGGVVHTAVLTAYRQASLKVLYFLSLDHPNTIKNLKKATKLDNVNNILYKNYYGWFNNIARGQYDLSEKGLLALKTNAELISQLIALEKREKN